jgi:HD-GYP domain-containing protein (c-di-GMP phosphodiesterase class II)
VALVIRHHHERVDGCGYPAGLRGEQIPLVTRIVTVADAYATMVAGRPYRNPIPPANAVEELRVHAGRQFDPEVVDALADAIGVRGVVVPLPVAARG